MAIARKDEILEKVLSGDATAVPRYNLRRPDGTLIGENVSLELANIIAQNGTPVNAAALNEMLAASGVTAGTASAYTLAQEGFALFDGAPVRFRLHAASGAGATLNVNGTGAKALINGTSKPFPAGIPAGVWIAAIYSEVYDAYVAGGSSEFFVLSDETVGAAASIVIPVPEACKQIHIEVDGVDIEYTNTYISVSMTNASKCSRNEAQQIFEGNGVTTTSEYYGSNNSMLSNTLIDGRTKVTIDVKFSGSSGYFEAKSVALSNTSEANRRTIIGASQGIATMNSNSGEIVIEFTKRILTGSHLFVTGVIA